MKIGEFLISKGLINDQQRKQILDHAHANSLRFGDAAIDLGVVSHQEFVQLFGPGHEDDFFYLHADKFPQATQSALSLELIVQYAVLPLGSKTTSTVLFRREKRLNVGMVDPSDRQARKAIEEFISNRAEFSSIKYYLVLPEQFIAILKSVYGVKEPAIVRDSKNESVRLFLPEGE